MILGLYMVKAGKWGFACQRKPPRFEGHDVQVAIIDQRNRVIILHFNPSLLLFGDDLCTVQI